MRRCIVLLLLCAVAGWAQQKPPAGMRGFSLNDRALVSLPADWAERHSDNLPPPFLLAGSAPRLVFSDLLALENRDTWEVLKIGVSENSFVGSNPAALEDHVHASGLNYLFYFFFPPSRNCLARAKAALESAEAVEEARHKDDEDKKQRQTVSITQNCQATATPLDFYAAQVSSGLTFNSEGRSRGLFRPFYIPPTERLELDGKTFFIFEAQGQSYVDQPELDFFNLPNDKQGARAYLFWAVGADTPFPFVFDPVRKNVQLVHVAYACLNSNGLARPAFLEKLRSLRF